MVTPLASSALAQYYLLHPEGIFSAPDGVDIRTAVTADDLDASMDELVAGAAEVFPDVDAALGIARLLSIYAEEAINSAELFPMRRLLVFENFGFTWV